MSINKQIIEDQCRKKHPVYVQWCVILFRFLLLLKNIGIGSISPVVDVTNYISYSFGQPMHAYDADKIENTLINESMRN